MARELEELRATGQLDSYSADEAVGIAVNNLMFQKRLTRKQLGEALGVSGQVVSRKIRGEVTWSILDIMRTADFLGVSAADLLPKKKETPAQPKLDGSPDFVAGTGFEPVTSGWAGSWAWSEPASGWLAVQSVWNERTIQPQDSSAGMGGRARTLVALAASSRPTARNR